MIGFARDAWRYGTVRAVRRTRHRLIPEAAVIIAAPFLWWTFDRTPPLDLYAGVMMPSTVKPGDVTSVVWRARFAGRDCRGQSTSQREIVLETLHAPGVPDLDGLVVNKLYPENQRARGGNFQPDPSNQFIGTVTTPPLLIPGDILPVDSRVIGGEAYYQVTQRYYCNWWQEFWRWPIVKESPRIYFTVRR